VSHEQRTTNHEATTQEERSTNALNGQGKPTKGSRLLILGIAYKKNVDGMLESPSVALMEQWRAKGARIAYSDLHVPVVPKMREHRFDPTGTPLEPETLASVDCVVIATDHDAFDYVLTRCRARLIVDTRGVYLKWAANVLEA